MTKALGRLSGQEQRFVQELVKTKDPDLALKASGIVLPPGREARQLAKSARIRAAVTELRGVALQRVSVDAEWVLYRLVDELNADLADLYDDAGALKPIDQWPTVWRTGLVAGVDVEQITDGDGVVIGQVKKVRLSDRLKRIELLGKHIGVKAFEERVNVGGLSDLAEQMARALVRIEAEPKVIDGSVIDG